MRRSLPYCHCIKSQCEPRCFSSITRRFGAMMGISPRIAPQQHIISPPLLQKRDFSLLDLSQFSPFASSSKGSAKGGDDFNTYHESVVMPFDKKLLFDIVSDVEQYDTFVPYCVQSSIDSSSQKQISQDGKEFLADLAIGYGQVRESYTSKVTIIDGKSVQATAVPTPLFQKLQTKWSFANDIKPNSTKVDFQVDYSFSNPFYAAFAKTAIEKMTTKMIDSFTQRAQAMAKKESHKQL